MSWGTAFTADLYIYREYFDSIEDIETSIKEKEDYIQRLKSYIYVLVGGNIIPEEYKDEPASYLSNEISDQIDLILETQIAITKLEMLKSNFHTMQKD